MKIIPLLASRSRRGTACLILWLGVGAGAADVPAADPSPAQPVSAMVTNISQLRRLAGQQPAAGYSIMLEGNVWWADRARGKLVLRDDSGGAELEMDLPDQAIEPGRRLRLTGNATVIRRGAAIQIGAHGPVVDNNGEHALIEKSGAVYLEAGRQPIRVEWFNGVEGFGLEVEYEGPGLPRRRIPEAALFRPEPGANDPDTRVNGLDFRCYEIAGDLLTDGEPPAALRTGVVDNFNLGMLPRNEHIGVTFTGFLAVPRSGLYTFHLKSDDGSRLFVGKPSLRLDLIGTATFPRPQRITVGQMLGAEEDGQWVEVEGKVTLARKSPEGLRLELSAGAGHLRVEIGNDSGLSAAALLNRRVRAMGFCQSVRTTDGQNVAGVLLVPGRGEMELLEEPSDPPRHPDLETNSAALPLLLTAGEVHRLKREEARRGYPVRIRGVVTCVLPEHQAFTIQDGTRGLYVVDFSSSRPNGPQTGEYLEVEGTTDPSKFAPIVNARRVRSLGAGRRPEATRPTWDQLINGSLDAQQVELQGIVTAVRTNGLTLLTRGGVVKVELRLAGGTTGDLVEFANALIRIRGCLLASWDYVTHQVRMGDVRIYAADILVDQPAPADLFSSPRKTAGELLLFDPQAGVFQRVKVIGQIVYARDAEYFLMDGGRGLRFITKQPVTLAAGDTVEVVGFPDLLGSASPVLREAVVRKTGRAPLPSAQALPPDDLIRADHDATRVKVEGLLVAMRRLKADTVLEMQSGVRTFVAHLPTADAAVESLVAGSRLELTGVYAGLGGNRAAGQDIASFELLLQTPADIRVLARPAWWTLKRLLVIVGALACVLAAAALWISQLHRQVEERTAELGAQIQERQRVEHQRAMETERTRIAQDLHDELGSGITEISMLAARAKSAAAPDEQRARHLDQVGRKARELVTALDEIVWAMNPRHDSLASLVSYFSLYADRFLGLAGIAWRLEGPGGPPDQAVDSRRRHQLFLAFKEALTNVVRHSGATEVRLHITGADGALRLSIADNGRGLPGAHSHPAPDNSLSSPKGGEGRGEEAPMFPDQIPSPQPSPRLGGERESATAAGHSLPAGGPAGNMDGVANMRARIEKLGGRFEISGPAGRGTTVQFSVPSHFKS